MPSITVCLFPKTGAHTASKAKRTARLTQNPSLRVSVPRLLLAGISSVVVHPGKQATGGIPGNGVNTGVDLAGDGGLKEQKWSVELSQRSRQEAAATHGTRRRED